MSFRHHPVQARLKVPTFTEVPPSWAKAGIHMGDRLVTMNGRTIEGIHLIRDLKPFLEAKFESLRAAKADIPFVLRIQAEGTTETRIVNVILKSKTAFTLFAGLWEEKMT